MNHIKILNDAEYRSYLESFDQLTVIDCWAPQCEPCRFNAPVFEEMSRQFGKEARFAKLNVTECPYVVSALKLQFVPQILFVRNSTVIDRIAGIAGKKDFVAKIRRLAVSQ